MQTCQYCKNEIPANAGFCGSCGQIISKNVPDAQTHLAPPMHQVPLSDEKTVGLPQNLLSAKDQAKEDLPTQIITTYNGDAITSTEEEEEEKRRYAAFIGMVGPTGMPQPTMNMPMVQGTPQGNVVPSVAGTPPTGVEHPLTYANHRPAGEFGTQPTTPSPAGEFAMQPTTPSLVLPGPQSIAPSPPAYGLPLTGKKPGPPIQKPQPPHSPQSPPGCALWLILLLIPLIILGSLLGISLTILAPALSLQGSADVPPGGTLHLHGSHFIPGNIVTCLLDGITPLSVSSRYNPIHKAYTARTPQAMMLTNMVGQTTQISTLAASDTTITVAGDGTFDVTFTVGQNWSIGQHTIRATETLSPRSATLTFQVSALGSIATPTVTGTTTVTTTTPKASPTVASSPTSTPTGTTGLSAITPGNITFGPLSDGYQQAVSTQVTLNTSGTGLLNWTATWDKAQAPWLQLNLATGQIQAPNTQTIGVSASAGTLTAGTYSTIVNFSNNAQNAQTVSLAVSLSIQAGCVKVTPSSLNFTGTIGAANPPAQTIALNNCGAIGNWSESSTGGSWFVVSPTSGNLSSGASQSIAVASVLANAATGAGTYHGQILFTNGSGHFTVNVTLTLQPRPVPATLSINTNSITTGQCTRGTARNAFWICSGIILSSNQDATSNLSWSATSSGITGLTVNPTSGTLVPGQTTPIVIEMPRFPCNQTATVTFTGPNNSVSLTVSCPVLT